MKKRKSTVILLTLFLTIGFAAVSTTLIFNGNIGIGVDTNFSDDVIFTYADMGENGTAEIINQGKAITFTTKELLDIGSEVILDFKISNQNRGYDAIADITCETATESEEFSEYISVLPDKNEYQIAASSTVPGKLTTTYKKAYLGTEDNNNAQMKVVCKLNVEAKEKEVLEDDIVVTHNSEDVEYLNDTLEEVTNVKQALDYIYGRLNN